MDIFYICLFMFCLRNTKSILKLLFWSSIKLNFAFSRSLQQQTAFDPVRGEQQKSRLHFDLLQNRVQIFHHSANEPRPHFHQDRSSKNRVDSVSIQSRRGLVSKLDSIRHHHVGRAGKLDFRNPKRKSRNHF